MDSETLVMNFVATDKIVNVLDNIGRKLEQAGTWAQKFGGVIGDAFGGALKAVGDLLPVIGGLIGVGGGLFALLDHLVTKQGEYALTVESTSDRLKINTGLLQTIYQTMGLAGQSTDTVNMSLTRFAGNLAVNGTILKALGLTLTDVGIRTHDAGEAFLQLADWEQKVSDKSELAKVNLALFGRNTQAMTAFLIQGRDGIQAINAELQNFGVILDNGQLALATTGRVMQDEFHLELQGLTNTVAQAAMPAFTMLWTVLGKLVNPTGELGGVVRGLAQALANAVMWTAAFVSALFGLDISVGDITKSMNSALTAFDLAAGGGNGLADATQGATAAANAQSQALQDQIQNLQDARTASDDASSAVVEGLQAQQSAYDDLMASQIAVYDQKLKEMDLAKQQSDAAQRVKDDQQKIADLQEELARAPFIGQTDTSGIQKQLAAAQEQLVKDQAQTQFDANKQVVQDTISSLQQAQKARDDTFKDVIKQDQLEQKAKDEVFKGEIRGLQETLKEVQRKDAAATQSAMGSATAQQGITAGLTAAQKGAFASVQSAVSGNYAGVAGAARDAANSVNQAWGNVLDILVGAKIYSGGGTFYRSGGVLGALGDIANALKGLVPLADAAVKAIKPLAEMAGGFNNAVMTEPKQAGKQLQTGDASGLVKLLADISGYNLLEGFFGGPKVGGAEGAIVTQPTMALIGEAGPEVLMPLHRMPGASPLPSSTSTPSDETLPLLRSIDASLRVIAQSGGSETTPTGMMAALTRLLSNNDYQRSRGVVVHSPA